MNKKIIFILIAILTLLYTMNGATADLILGEYYYNYNYSAQMGSAKDLDYRDGYIYVLDSNNHLIKKLNALNGSEIELYNFSGQIPSFSIAYGMCFDGTNFYVSEYQNKKRVYEINQSGIITGFNFSYTDEMNIGRGLYCDGDYIYLAGSGVVDVGYYKYDYDGNYTGVYSIDLVVPFGCHDIVKTATNFYCSASNSYNAITEFSLAGVKTGNYKNISHRTIGTVEGLTYDGTNFYTVDSSLDSIIIWSTLSEIQNDTGDERANYSQYELVLSDTIETKTNIVAMDYDNDDGRYAGFGAFVGYDDDGATIGVASLYLPNQFSNEATKNTNSKGYKAIDIYETTIWTASSGMIERYGAIFGAISLSSSTATSYNATGVFNDLNAVNDSFVVACYEESGSSYVQSFKLNNSNRIELLDSLSVDYCKGVILKDDIIYYDAKTSGVGLINYTDNTNLVSLDTLDLRTNPLDFGRHDLLGLKNDYLISDTNSEVSILIDVTDKTNVSDSELTCEIDEGSIMAVELINSSLSYISSSNNGDIYLCNYITGSARLVYDNPFNNLAFDLNLLDEAGQNYVYTYEGSNLLVLTLSDLDVDNAMPSFFSATPDSSYVPNNNPIVLGGDPSGLDNPLVIPYPLNCDSSFYECSFDTEGDNILFAVDPDYDGVLTSPDWFSFETYSITYDEAGTYTMRIYLTDDVHENLYSVHRDFTIEVRANVSALGENESTLRFKILDSNTNTVLSSVFVNVEGGTDAYANINGEYAEVIDEGVYIVTFTKTGYFDHSGSFGTSPLFQQIHLTPISDPDKRTLQITVKNVNGSFIENVFIQLQMPNIVQFDFGYTDANGQAIFYPEDDNVVIVIDADGYAISSTELYIPLGTTIYRTVTLNLDYDFTFVDLIDGGGFNLTGCQDIIRGVLLCDYDKVTNCSINAECITGLCSQDGHCSNFNWNLCDEQSIERGNRCFISNMAKGVMRATSDWILTNFLYVLIIVLVLLALLIFAIKNK